jgi:hypothetical protein
MITKTRNADGTITITTDEDTAAEIWAHTWAAAQDTDNTHRTRDAAREIANALNDEPGWRLD